MVLFLYLGRWIAAVLKHWAGWVVGTGVSVILLIGQEFWEWQPSRWQFILILSLGLLWSMFAAWRDEHEERLKADRAGLPLATPYSYLIDPRRSGFMIRNSGYDGFDIHIPPVPFEAAGCVLSVPEIIPELGERDSPRFVEALLDFGAGRVLEGSHLPDVMDDCQVTTLKFKIICRASNQHSYIHNCLIVRDKNTASGIRVQYVNQEAGSSLT